MVPSLELVTTPTLSPANISKPPTAVKREEMPIAKREGRKMAILAVRVCSPSPCSAEIMKNPQFFPKGAANSWSLNRLLPLSVCLPVFLHIAIFFPGFHLSQYEYENHRAAILYGGLINWQWRSKCWQNIPYLYPPSSSLNSPFKWINLRLYCTIFSLDHA